MLSDTPEYVRLSAINITDYNIKEVVNYTFTVVRTNSYTFSNLYDNTFAIVIKLPKYIYEDSSKLISDGSISCSLSYNPSLF